MPPEAVAAAVSVSGAYTVALTWTGSTGTAPVPTTMGCVMGATTWAMLGVVPLELLTNDIFVMVLLPAAMVPVSVMVLDLRQGVFIRTVMVPTACVAVIEVKAVVAMKTALGGVPAALVLGVR